MKMFLGMLRVTMGVRSNYKPKVLIMKRKVKIVLNGFSPKEKSV